MLNKHVGKIHAPFQTMEQTFLYRNSTLTRFLRRLEAATSRLEDIASSSQSADGLEVVPGTSAAAVNRSAGAVQSHPSSIPPSSVAAPAAPAALPHQTLPRSVEEFDSIVQDDLQPFATLSDKLGDAVKDQVRRKQRPRLTHAIG